MNEIQENTIINDIDLGTIQETMKKISQMQALVQNTLKKDHDYGVIPGTNKPTLLKPGGEKICMLFGLTPEYEMIHVIEDFSRNFFSYNLKCTLLKKSVPVAQGVGSCNSKERKYRYSYVDKLPENYIGISDKVVDKYGKEKYRIENPDLCNFVNTILKMAKKRAFIDAVLQVASLSDIFTQDLEDISDFLQSSMDEAEPQKLKINFGKYKGDTLENILNKDKNYFMWLKENNNVDEAIKKACNLILEGISKDETLPN